MLFQIDQSVCDLISSSAATTADFSALSYLALAAAEGKHRLGGPRRVLAELSRCASLTAREKNAFERAASRSAEEGRLWTKLKVYSKVIASSALEPSSQRVGSQRIISVPLQWFDDSEKIQPTALLAENLSDADVLKKIGKAGTQLIGLGYLPLSVSPISGGGSTTAAALKSLASQNRQTLCIVDSDKIYPTGELGSTARNLNSFKNEVQYPLIEIVETRGRDLENHLPISFYLQTYDSHISHRRMARALSTLTEHDEIDIRTYLDIERGLLLYDVLKFAPDSGERVFWTESVRRMCSLSIASESELGCLQQGICAHETRSDCRCIVIAGLPANILQDFFNRNGEADAHDLCANLDAVARIEWTRLGGSIASWACGDQKLRV